MTETNEFDIEAVRERLPHRYPFLLVDRVLECRREESIVAIKNVTVNEPFFAGHFPAYPVMPGVLIVEALAQTAGVLAWESAGAEHRESVPFLAGIEKARFKHTVRPGDQLLMKVNLIARRRNVWRFDASAEVDGRLAAQAEFLIAAGTMK
jgi:3-hydroxyacyl-[acyl-carrier-protein] dehydratase